MAKLTLLAALLAALVFIVHSSAYKTTVTTVEIDNGANPWQPEQEMCQKQLEKVNMKHCEKHVMKKIEQEEQEEDEDEDNVLTLRGIYRNHHQELKQCCEQLSQLKDQRCQCLAMQEILLKQAGKLQKKQLHEMKKELKNLPNTCEMEPMEGCDLAMFY